MESSAATLCDGFAPEFRRYFEYCRSLRFDDLEEDVLGYAGVVYEVNLGEENYTFIDEVKIQGRTRERNSQLQRLISRPFSTRFG